jgi:hypothetical protein
VYTCTLVRALDFVRSRQQQQTAAQDVDTCLISRSLNFTSATAAATAAAAVEAIFGKLCECSALNPDSDVEDEAGAQLFFDEAEVSIQTHWFAAPLAAAKAAN